MFGISDQGELSEEDGFDLDPGWSHISFDPNGRFGVLYNEVTQGISIVAIPPSINQITTLSYNVPPTPQPVMRWTQFVPLRLADLWFWYMPGTGTGLVLRINDDGTTTTFQGYTNFEQDWTHIISAGLEAKNGDMKMVFYKQGKGVLNTAHVTGFPDFVKKQTYSGLSPNWSIMAGTRSGIVLFYDASGNIATDMVDDAGNETALKRYSPK
jgi:hypothetical protein